MSMLYPLGPVPSILSRLKSFCSVFLSCTKHNLLERRKGGGGNIRDILYQLTYHDVYFLYKHIKHSEIEEIIPIELSNKLRFKVKFNDIGVNFCYDVNYSGEKIHHINGLSLIRNETDDDYWVYIERTLTKGKFHKLGKHLLKENNVLALHFNKYGILAKKEIFRKEDINKIRFTEKETNNDLSEKSFVQSFLESVKQKMYGNR